MEEIAEAEEKEAALAKQQKRGQKDSSQTISEVDDNYDDLVS